MSYRDIEPSYLVRRLGGSWVAEVVYGEYNGRPETFEAGFRLTKWGARRLGRRVTARIKRERAEWSGPPVPQEVLEYLRRNGEQITLRVLPTSRGAANPRAETTPDPALRDISPRMAVHGE